MQGSPSPDKRACPCCGILAVTPTKWDGWMCENSYCDVRSFRSRTQVAAPVMENDSKVSYHVDDAGGAHGKDTNDK